MNRYEIVPGYTVEGVPVHRVVLWEDEQCRGGLGSFFHEADAKAFIQRKSRPGNPLNSYRCSHCGAEVGRGNPKRCPMCNRQLRKVSR